MTQFVSQILFLKTHRVNNHLVNRQPANRKPGLHGARKSSATFELIAEAHSNFTNKYFYLNKELPNCGLF